MIYWFFGLPGSGKDYCAKLMKKLIKARYFHIDDFLTEEDKEKLINGTFTISDRINKLKRVSSDLSEIDLSLVNIVAADSLPDTKSRGLLQTRFGNNIMFIYVRVEPKTHERRMKERKNHFFTYSLLDSWVKKHWEPVNMPHIVVDNNSDGDEVLTKLLKEVIKTTV